MKTCATCRFFGSPMGLDYWDENENVVSSGHHACARIIHGNGGEEATAARELAIVTDGSGYAARLRVLPTFGCVLHEERTP